MTRPIAAITNAKTGQTTYEEMNDVDYAIYLSDIENYKIETATKAEAEAQAANDKAALLDKLGITADEAKLLLS